MTMRTAKGFWRASMWLSIMNIVVNPASFLFPDALKSQPIIFVLLAYVLCAWFVGLISVIFLYAKQRQTFHVVFGLLFGYSYILGGLSEAPQPDTLLGSVALGLVTALIPAHIAVILRNAIRRADRQAETQGTPP